MPYLKRGIEKSELDAIAVYHPSILSSEEYYSIPTSEFYGNSYEEYIE